MKKWYQWFYLSLAFAAGGILNYIDGRRVTASVIQVGITLILGIIQLLCENKGEAGKKAFQYISIAAIALLVLWILLLIRDTFGQ